jgi:hypothetical protein
MEFPKEYKNISYHLDKVKRSFLLLFWQNSIYANNKQKLVSKRARKKSYKKSLNLNKSFSMTLMIIRVRLSSYDKEVMMLNSAAAIHWGRRAKEAIHMYLLLDLSDKKGYQDTL